jgi:diguanylate cyclase (GGDEF)-like protein
MSLTSRRRDALPAIPSAAHIARALLSISAIAIAVVGLGACLLSYSFLHRQTQRHLHTLISFVASESRSALEFRDTETATDILKSIPEGEGITYAEIRDAHDVTLARIGSHANGWIGDEKVTQDVVLESRRIGSVTLEGGGASMRRTLTGLVLWFGVGMVLIAAIALLLTRRYTQRFTEPIRQLHGVVRRMSADHDYNRRAPPSSLAEVEDLRIEFNALLDEIRLRDRLLMESHAALERAAYTDALTDLPNRAIFEPTLQETLESCRTGAARACLFFLDVDALKSVNDALGHAIGDQLLSRLAQRLRRWRSGATVLARIGGDEFVMLTWPLDADTDIERIRIELQTELEVPMQLDHITLHPGISIGTAVYPDETGDAAQLMSLADQAMYATKNKRHHKNQVTRWESGMNQPPANSDWITAAEQTAT